jgi:hypothetical protein
LAIRRADLIEEARQCEGTSSSAARTVGGSRSIDVIDTKSFRDEDLDGLDPGDRLFVVSHRWALDTATDTELVAGDATASIGWRHRRRSLR